MGKKIYLLIMVGGVVIGETSEIGDNENYIFIWLL
ncbi:MAG: hypothetical protein CM1200mP13_16830 [Candidatus Pelagibacterales bacterium]|nr:MAG: hypothetical protein CM1200mP13_16830 [Pelagibacterales bacterium]